MDDSKYYELRCNAERKHNVKGVEYKKCGNMFGGISKEGHIDVIQRCPICGHWNRYWKEDDESGLLNFEILDARKFNFTQPLRTGR